MRLVSGKHANCKFYFILSVSFLQVLSSYLHGCSFQIKTSWSIRCHCCFQNCIRYFVKCIKYPWNFCIRFSIICLHKCNQMSLLLFEILLFVIKFMKQNEFGMITGKLQVYFIHSENKFCFQIHTM